MSTTTRTILIDDLDGTTSEDSTVTTVTFAIGGVTYKIDLSETNAEALGSALAPYIAAARNTPSRASKPRAVQADVVPQGPKASEIRIWAREHDIDVPVRGRIPNAIIERYRLAA